MGVGGSGWGVWGSGFGGRVGAVGLGGVRENGEVKLLCKFKKKYFFLGGGGVGSGGGSGRGSGCGGGGSGGCERENKVFVSIHKKKMGGGRPGGVRSGVGVGEGGTRFGVGG